MEDGQPDSDEVEEVSSGEGGTLAEASRTRVLGESDARSASGRRRDAAARRRDEQADKYDEAARRRDADAEAVDRNEEIADRHTLRLEELRGRARAARARAASDRDRAARDRRVAAADRRTAAEHRKLAARDRDQAGSDDLTGARRRGVGLEEVENEILRVRRSGGTLVAAYADVNGLKLINDRHGHAAGDERLCAVADLLRARMRPYDLIVRVGGDEFLCALPDVPLAEAKRRFEDLLSADGVVSMGFSELRQGESATALMSRADMDLLAARAVSRGYPTPHLVPDAPDPG